MAGDRAPAHSRERRAVIKQKFLDFLADNQALDGFMKNQDVDNLELFLDMHDPAIYLRGAFHWKHSPEGFEFWYELNNKWQKELLK